MEKIEKEIEIEIEKELVIRDLDGVEMEERKIEEMRMWKM